MNVKNKDFITNSLLDIDYYKLTMLRFVFAHYRGIKVKFSFTNRTKSVRLAEVIDKEELCAELEHARTLRFTEDEIVYLSKDPHLNEPEFLRFLANYSLPPLTVEKNKKLSTYRIEAEGAWEEVALWETIVLHTIAELYARSFLAEKTPEEISAIYAEGDARLSQKLIFLKQHPEIRFSEFGTRRRFSRKWQENVTRRFVEEVPKNILGTSNVFLAKKLGIRPIGTMAHELFMALLALRIDTSDVLSVTNSQREVLQKWRELYGEDLSCALTDTLGTDHFFNEVLMQEDAFSWKSFRQDSGSPYECGEKIIAFCKRHGADVSTKSMVASDGLTVEKMADISAHFIGRLSVVYGWGTNATNDLGFPACSLVMKLTEAEGKGTVKLSDNLAKAIGPEETLRFVKDACGYASTRFDELTY